MSRNTRSTRSLVLGFAVVLSASTAANAIAQDAVPAAAQAPAAAPAAAQAAPAQSRPDPNAGSVRVVVLDQSGAAIVGAAVSVVPAGAASGTAAKTATANDQGEAIVDGLAPGKYLVQIESIGFETKQIADLNIRKGRQEKRQVELPIAGYVEEVQVTRDKTDQALTDNFSSALTPEQIDALPDDEEEMADQLAQMAGPGAVLRVNGFSGGRLPPKSQIAEIRFRFDPYSAENHEAGFPRVDIRTRPGNGNWRNNATFTFRDESMNARNAFAPEKTPEQARRYQYQMDGPIVKGKTSFSLNVGGLSAYDTETIHAESINGEIIEGAVAPPTDRLNLNARVEHAFNKNNMFRAEYSRNGNDQELLGVGGFDLLERAYSRDATNNQVRLSTNGTLPWWAKARNELRFEVGWDDTESVSASDALTLIIPQSITRGGQQLSGGRTSKTIQIADNVDFQLGKKHAMRAGLLIDGGTYRSDESRNYTGTFTFASNEELLAGRALQFSQRIGDPLVEYNSYQFGLYLQDDMRLRKNLLFSAGLRYEAQTTISDNVNLQPRVSVAWTPFKSGSTTIRGGFGVFNDWYEDSLYEQALRLDGTHQVDVIVPNPSYPNADLSAGRQIPPSITRVSADLVMPTIARTSFGIEHAFTSWAQLRTNWFYQHTADDFRSVNLNAPVDGIRPVPEYGNITFVNGIGTAESQGIDVSMSLNYAPKRIFGTINYRLAKAMNDGDSATSFPENGTDIAAEWGPARNDVRHRIFGFVSTPLRFGLRTNVNMRYESAVPYNITTGFDDNGDTVINDRPAGVGRNSARGTGLFNLDFRLGWQKSIGQPRTGDNGPGGPGGGPTVIAVPGPGGGGRGGPGGGFGGGGFGPGGGNGRVNLEIFTQVTNLTNAVNYRNYVGTMTSTQFFGKPTAAGEARRIEIGMRVGF